MTNENSTQGVMQVNTTSGDVIQPSFIPNLPTIGYALSFDKNGNVWVGDTNAVLEYSPSGVLLQTITDPSFNTIFAATFNPAGDTFYAGDLGSGSVFTYNLSGTQLGSFNVGSGISGLSVAGSIVTPKVPEGVPSPSSLTFPPDAVRTRIPSQTVTLTSTGTAPLVISTATLTDPNFVITSTTCTTGLSL